MKKWMAAVISVVMLAALVFGPAGCGGNQATEIDVDEEDVKQPSGHEQALKQLYKKPSSN
ncbi:MAG: hypothetical protein ACQESR_11145 [Planctomycetota bacterium]